jgi:aerobic carbon-monoxide dehydrogenase medium subunit
VRAIGARMVIRSTQGERVLTMDEFHRGPYRTAVGPAEMLTEVRVPIAAGTGSAYEKVERRVGDWAVAAAGVSLQLSGGRIERAGIALAAVGAGMKATAAEQALTGQPPSLPRFAQAAAIAAENCSPVADQRGSQEYKRHVAGVLTERALQKAFERATEEV